MHLPDPDDWIAQAEADLHEAEKAFHGRGWYVCALLSQQAAEKALKAVIIFREKSLPPKIHDLVDLARRVKAPESLMAATESLTPAYIYSRYPGVAPEIPVKFYTQQKVKPLLEQAREVVRWTKQKLG